MNKFNEFELIGIGVSIYLVCLIFGSISKHIFGFDVDVLSASATLFAAVVAMLLFSDWKDPHNAQKILEEQKDIMNSLHTFRVDFYNFRNCIETISEADIEEKNIHKEYIQLETILLNSLDKISDCLHIYGVNFNNESDEKLNNEHLNKIVEFRKKVKDLYDILTKFDSTINFKDAYSHISTSKTTDKMYELGGNLTLDLRDEILDYKKIKGH